MPVNPDAIFIGGGLTQPGVFDNAWQRLTPGGRLVANAVTVESAALLWQLRETYGGHITEFRISTEKPVGSFTTLSPALPVTQWVVRTYTKDAAL